MAYFLQIHEHKMNLTVGLPEIWDTLEMPNLYYKYPILYYVSHDKFGIFRSQFIHLSPYYFGNSKEYFYDLLG